MSEAARDQGWVRERSEPREEDKGAAVLSIEQVRALLAPVRERLKPTQHTYKAGSKPCPVVVCAAYGLGADTAVPDSDVEAV